jgi:hypothetical protein
MTSIISKRNIAIIAAIAVAAIVVGTYFVWGLSAQSKVPNIKFIEFVPEGTITIKQGDQLAIRFNIVNNEPYPVTGASVSTMHDGQSQFFTLDRPLAAINGTIGANGGRTGMQTVSVFGNVNNQQAVESNFTVRLYVTDGQLVDTKTFKVRLEK